MKNKKLKKADNGIDLSEPFTVDKIKRDLKRMSQDQSVNNRYTEPTQPIMASKPVQDYYNPFVANRDNSYGAWTPIQTQQSVTRPNTDTVNIGNNYTRDSISPDVVPMNTQTDQTSNMGNGLGNAALGAAKSLGSLLNTSVMFSALDALLPEQKKPTTRTIDRAYNPNPFGNGSQAIFEDGGVVEAKSGIHIKPENRGKFTETKKRTGKSTEELTHSKNPLTRKRAIFAQNAKKWHHAENGIELDDNANLNTLWGGDIEQVSDNDFSNPMLKFVGQSHDESDGNGNTGIGLQYGNKNVEVEHNELGYVDTEGSLNVFGGLKPRDFLEKEHINVLSDALGVNIGSKNFTSIANNLAKEEASIDKKKYKSLDILNNVDPMNKYNGTAFNSAKVMFESANKQSKDITLKKELISNLQSAILHTTDQKVAKYGAKIPKAKDGINLEDYLMQGKDKSALQFYDPFTQNLKAMLTDAPDEVRKNFKIQSGYRSKDHQAKLWADAIKKYGTESAARKWVAPPGNSEHEFGIAADLNFSKDPTTEKWLHENADKYNLQFRMDNEDWHVSLKPGDNKPWAGNFDKTRYENQYFNNPDMNDETPVLANTQSTQNNQPQFEKVNYLNSEDNTNSEVNRGRFTNVFPDGRQQAYTDVEAVNSDNIKFTEAAKKPTNASGLNIGQIAPELFSLATNRQEPVTRYNYTPNLFTPYQVSSQDRLNENNASFKELARQLPGNSAALGVLAGQKYSADNQVMAENFRVNQGISNEIANKNTQLLNEAKLQNINLNRQADIQQDQSKFNTRKELMAAMSSIAKKYSQNNLENKTLQAYENLYNYRFDKNGNAVNYNDPVTFTANNNRGLLGSQNQDPDKMITKANSNGTSSTTTINNSDRAEYLQVLKAVQDGVISQQKAQDLLQGNKYYTN